MSLRLRLTLLSGLLTSATVLTFALFFYVRLQADLSSKIDAQLQERANLVMQTLRATGGLENNAQLTLPLPLVEFDTPGIYVELITPDGQVRASSPNLSAEHLPADPMLITAARIGRTGIGTVTVGNGEQLRLLAAPMQSGIVLLVAESLEPLRDTLAQARVLLVVGGMISVTLAVSGAALVTERALAPIARLTRAAADIAATGQYHKRVPPPRRNDEVGQLTATINELIAMVDRTIGQHRQFLADTSHELRSPLTIVLANLDLLRRDLDPHERDLSIQEATAEAKLMRRLVNDLLLLAQSDAAQAIAHTSVRLDKLIKEMVGVAARQAPGHVIQTQAEVRVTVMGDPERLRQLLRNLLENATQHTPPGTTVTVCLRRLNGAAQIAITDTGPGIPATHLPFIWDRFYRVDKARSRIVAGAGLGLAIVKYLAEAHGGSVGVVSELGRGTTVTVALPLMADGVGV